MRKFARFLPTLIILAATVAAGGFTVPLQAGTTDKQALTEKKLAQVKVRIKALAHEQRQAAAQRDSINTRLANQSDALAKASAAVRESNQALADNQKQIDQLLHRRDQLKAHLATQREALADLLRAAYATGRGSDLRLLLGDTDLARIARALAYSRYFQHDRIQRIKDLIGQLDQLHQVKQAIGVQRQALEAKRTDHRQHVAKLQQVRDEQQALLSQANTRIRNQHQQIQQLQHQQQSLQQLLKQLRNVLADVPDKLPADAPFSTYRGKLPWPVKGKVRKRGKGLVIEAAHGTAVHAVAHGRIAYADWLRGYGLLVVIDHGDGWMSLYGGNESVLHGVGDWVHAGEPIATAGAGMGDDSGVYFGLRHDSKPVDPLRWLTKRH